MRINQEKKDKEIRRLEEEVNKMKKELENVAKESNNFYDMDRFS